MEAVASEVKKNIFVVELNLNYTQAVRHFKKSCPDHPQPHQQVVRGLDRYWCEHEGPAARKALGLAGGLTVWRDLTEEWRTITLEDGRIRIELDETILAATDHFTAHDSTHLTAEEQARRALICYWATDLFSGIQAYEIATQTPAPNPAQSFDPESVANLEAMVADQLKSEEL